MEIRPAELKDLKSLVEIYNQAIRAGRITAHTNEFSTSERLSWFEEHSSKKFPIFVAQTEEGLAGYASLSPYRSGRYALSISAEISYYIHFDHHHKGIGTALVRAIIDFAREKDFEVLIAILLNANEASIGLLRKTGFSEWGRMPGVANFDGDRLDHLYYGINL